jgi:hypothetical protein
MSTLRSAAIRLAHSSPGPVRAALLPVLKKTAAASKIKKVRIVDAEPTRKGIFMRAVVSVDPMGLRDVIDAIPQPVRTNTVSNALGAYFGEEGVEDVVQVMIIDRLNNLDPDIGIEPEYRVSKNPAPVWSLNNLGAGIVELQALVIEE